MARARVRLVLILVSNLGTLPDASIPVPAARAAAAGAGCTSAGGCTRRNPRRNQGWLVVVGRRTDGNEEDLLRGGRGFVVEAGRAVGAPCQRALAHLSGEPLAPAAAGPAGVRRVDVPQRECAHRDGEARLESVAVHYVKVVAPAPGGPTRVDRVELGQERCSPRARAQETAG